MDTYDLVVIGTGPAGHFGAIQAAKLGKRVAAIESQKKIGGACAVTGTIPSKALREATMHLMGLRQRMHYGMNYRVKDDLTIDDLTMTTGQIVHHEVGVLEAQLRRNGVDLLPGNATFIGPHQVRVECGGVVRRLRADKILVACGASPAHPPGMDFDGERIIDSRQILGLKTLPRTMTVVGAGVIGVEYACIFAALGTRVTLINQREDFLEFVDREIVETLKYLMQSRNVDFRLGEQVTDVERMGDFVVATTLSNKKLAAECLLYSVGRQGNTDSLAVETAGISVDERGRIEVNDHYQTIAPHIYAAGDVIGFPALAATSREQGRQAICHAFGVEPAKTSGQTPLGIYAIPEISMIGPTEQELTANGVPYEIGRARYREIARGQLLGDVEGMLKILFERDTRKVLAVHIIGEGATELIHIGQAAEAFGATLDYFASSVFNYPTLAECYKVAALDGINRVRLLNGIIESRGEVGQELQSVSDSAAPPTGIRSPLSESETTPAAPASASASDEASAEHSSESLENVEIPPIGEPKIPAAKSAPLEKASAGPSPEAKTDPPERRRAPEVILPQVVRSGSGGSEARGREQGPAAAGPGGPRGEASGQETPSASRPTPSLGSIVNPGKGTPPMVGDPAKGESSDRPRGAQSFEFSVPPSPLSRESDPDTIKPDAITGTFPSLELPRRIDLEGASDPPPAESMELKRPEGLEQFGRKPFPPRADEEDPEASDG